MTATTWEVVRAAATGIVAVLAGLVLYQVQQGTRGRRRRRRLIEEIDLFEKLAPWPEAQERQQIVVKYLMKRHLPPNDDADRLPSWVVLAGAAAGLATAVMCHGDVPFGMPFLDFLVGCVTAGAVGGFLWFAWASRKQWWERLRE